jgi:hypothetical protein
VFFLGLAATFLLVALLVGMQWAYWPAGVLGIIGAVSLVTQLEIGNYIWAFGLVAAGAYLLFKYFRNR